MESTPKSSRRVGRRRRRRFSCVNKCWPRQCGRDEQIIAVRQWMKIRSDFRCSLIPAVFADTGRGLMTKRSIRPGESLVLLPRNLLITTKTVLNSDIGQMIKSWEPKVTPQTCLAIFLIWEQHKKRVSDWFPYIQVLPPSFTTPHYFTQQELSFLPASVKQQAIEQSDKVFRIFKDVKDFCETLWPSFYNILTFEKFRHAWCVVNTRSLFLESDKSVYISDAEPDNIALAPFLDLLNHSPNANIKASFNKSSNCYEIVTYDSYKPYDQVFISYGCHSNRKLFLEYGFCVPCNPQDEFEFVYTDVLKACEMFKVINQNQKMQVLRQNNLLQSLSCSIDGLSWKLWTVLRTLAMDWSQLQAWNKIFTDEAVFDNTVPMATAIAKHLLQNYIAVNKAEQAYLDKNTCEADNREHIQICQTLLSSERQILTTSLVKLG